MTPLHIGNTPGTPRGSITPMSPSMMLSARTGRSRATVITSHTPWLEIECVCCSTRGLFATTSPSLLLVCDCVCDCACMWTRYADIENIHSTCVCVYVCVCLCVAVCVAVVVGGFVAVLTVCVAVTAMRKSLEALRVARASGYVLAHARPMLFRVSPDHVCATLQNFPFPPRLGRLPVAETRHDGRPRRHPNRSVPGRGRACLGALFRWVGSHEPAFSLGPTDSGSILPHHRWFLRAH